MSKDEVTDNEVYTFILFVGAVGTYASYITSGGWGGMGAISILGNILVCMVVVFTLIRLCVVFLLGKSNCE